MGHRVGKKGDSQGGWGLGGLISHHGHVGSVSPCQEQRSDSLREGPLGQGPAEER